jgi:hypothetical protein
MTPCLLGWDVRRHVGCAALPACVQAWKWSANGMPSGPVWRNAVHFREPRPGVLPPSPAWLER